MMSARFAIRSLRNCATICSSVGAARAGSADHASGANANATANKNLGFIRILHTLGDRDYEEGNGGAASWTKVHCGKAGCARPFGRAQPAPSALLYFLRSIAVADGAVAMHPLAIGAAATTSIGIEPGVVA